MLEGEKVLMVQGQPDKTVKMGKSYQVPSGAIHDAKAGPQGAKLIATGCYTQYVVDNIEMKKIESSAVKKGVRRE